MATATLLCIALTQLVLSAVAFGAGRSAGRWTCLLGCGLAYDSLVVATGAAMGEGAPLETLNAGRFVVHAVLTPAVIVCGALLLGPRRRTLVAAWLVAGASAVAGALLTLPGLTLEPRHWAGTLRYVAAGDHGAPAAAAFCILALLGIGVRAWIRDAVPWIALGAAAVFVASAFAFSVPLLGNAGEALMLAGLVAALRDHRTAGARLPVPSTG
ncbi:hypothetical protein [Streptomyces poriferorum]|uniref:Integral membrane protein n=1 Tax=Streptomyces poriferorum TaxID=2798799 RepID=A0ABY9IS58_9ACTN|nr:MULTISPECIES: hypothetical protein [unclassified Streptomyces]MDP5312748.1 hypothetical protein [Streptomyces sp. Alt4]WLQ58235.1 hypothetical protein P8A19_23625 [Streptomyces sp. Alt2]